MPKMTLQNLGKFPVFVITLIYDPSELQLICALAYICAPACLRSRLYSLQLPRAPASPCSRFSAFPLICATAC